MAAAERAFGSTGLRVSSVGLGCGGLGDASLSAEQATRLIHAALDLGVRLFDAARSYGDAEERLGAALAGRDAVVVTKGGYGIEGVGDWTAEAVRAGIDEARRRLRRDVIDVFQLHSCTDQVIHHGEVTDALHHAVVAGHVRVPGYSGDGDALHAAVWSGRFGAVEPSFNVLDQDARRALPEASRRGLGIVVKRALANAAWRFDERPPSHDVGAYWDRARAFEMEPIARLAGLPKHELFLRYAAHEPGVSSVLVGTTKVQNLESAVAAVARGPLHDDVRAAIERRFQQVGADWHGIV